jgi:hypothetical protein
MTCEPAILVVEGTASAGIGGEPLDIPASSLDCRGKDFGLGWMRGGERIFHVGAYALGDEEFCGIACALAVCIARIRLVGRRVEPEPARFVLGHCAASRKICAICGAGVCFPIVTRTL